MGVRRYCLAALLFVSSSAGVVAQEPAPPELPPVTVRPGTEMGVPYEGGSGFGDISWSSDAIRSDNTLVGPYAQPVWTTQRPFPTTRAYVLPSGTVEFEQWVRPTWHEAEKTEFRMLEEIEFGLPGRFQLDLYERWNIEPNENNLEEANHEGVQIELRWALADWGVLPLNPTLYAEWIEKGGPQEKPNKYELKLLLADELTPDWFFASNVILEQETSGERETEVGWSNALATPLIERKLMGGVEMVLSGTTVHGNRSDAEVTFMIGPSLQLRPTNRTFLDVVGMFGTTPESPEAQMYVIFGYQFGLRAGPAEGYAGGPASGYFGGGGGISGPASTRGN